MTEEKLEKEFHEVHCPNQSPACHNKLDAFFKQWWDTPYTGSPAAGNKPSITGPGLAGGGFYDANGGCAPYGVDVPGDAGGTVPATLALTLGAPATFGPFTPGVAKDYTASTTANVISTAGDAALSIADPSAPSRPPGQRRVLAAGAAEGRGHEPGGTSTGSAAVSDAPLTLETYSAPVSNDAGGDRASRSRSAPPTRCAPAATARR